MYGLHFLQEGVSFSPDLVLDLIIFLFILVKPLVELFVFSRCPLISYAGWEGKDGGIFNECLVTCIHVTPWFHLLLMAATLGWNKLSHFTEEFTAAGEGHQPTVSQWPRAGPPIPALYPPPHMASAPWRPVRFLKNWVGCRVQKRWRGSWL